MGAPWCGGSGPLDVLKTGFLAAIVVAENLGAVLIGMNTKSGFALFAQRMGCAQTPS